MQSPHTQQLDFRQIFQMSSKLEVAFRQITDLCSKYLAIQNGIPLSPPHVLDPSQNAHRSRPPSNINANQPSSQGGYDNSMNRYPTTQQYGKGYPPNNQYQQPYQQNHPQQNLPKPQSNSYSSKNNNSSMNQSYNPSKQIVGGKSDNKQVKMNPSQHARQGISGNPNFNTNNSQNKYQEQPSISGPTSKSSKMPQPSSVNQNQPKSNTVNQIDPFSIFFRHKKDQISRQYPHLAEKQLQGIMLEVWGSFNKQEKRMYQQQARKLALNKRQGQPNNNSRTGSGQSNK